MAVIWWYCGSYMKRFIFVCLGYALLAGLGFAETKVETNIEGGNAEIVSVDDSTITFRPQLRDTKGWWFYWRFDVFGAQGKTIALQCADRNCFDAEGIAVSFDAGKTWKYTGRKGVDFKKGRLSLSIPEGAERVGLSFAIPYTSEHLDALLKKYSDRPEFKVRPLAKTKKGRQNIYITLEPVGRDATRKIAFTARHHACEMTANYVIDGIVSRYFSDTPQGKWARENLAVFIVPFVDYDGVLDGDQGKNRKPHDHNRDYVEALHPSVRAIKQMLPEWGGDKLRYALDIHCPYISKRNPKDINDRLFFTAPQSEKANRNLEKFMASLSNELAKSPDRPQLNPDDIVKYGTMWNKLKEPVNFKFWAERLPSVEFAASLEIPYTNISGKWKATPENAKHIGEKIIDATADFLK